MLRDIRIQVCLDMLKNQGGFAYSSGSCESNHPVISIDFEIDITAKIDIRLSKKCIEMFK